jgi:hypothetical protein
VIARYRGRGLALYFRGDAAFAKPELYELLEAEGIGYAIRLPANPVLQARIGHLLTRPVGRPAEEAAGVPRQLQLPGQSWTRPAAVGGQGRVAPGRALPAGRLHRHQPDPTGRAGQQVLQRPRYGEQWIKEGKLALRWTRLSCRAFRDNAVRLQLFALAYNLANFLRSLALPVRWRTGR